MDKFFIFAKVSLQGKFYDTESKRDGLLEWFDFWTTFLRDEINLGGQFSKTSKMSKNLIQPIRFPSQSG